MKYKIEIIVNIDELYMTTLIEWQHSLIVWFTFFMLHVLSQALHVCLSGCQFGYNLSSCCGWLFSRWKQTYVKFCFHTWFMISFFMTQMNLGEIFCQFIYRSFLQPVADLPHLVDLLHLQILIQVMSYNIFVSAERGILVVKKLIFWHQT